MNTLRRPALWSLVAGEPFRLFFPLGVLAGVVGVLLWPLHFLGVLPTYPGVGHARIMAHGFLGSFIVGFLGTALPRLLGVSPLSRSEVGLLASLQLATLTAHAAGQNRAGDSAFLMTLLLLAVAVGRRFSQRTDLPPPGFVLVALGMGCAIIGLALDILPSVQDESSASRLVLQSRLIYQGFLLLPVLGVGGFVFPALLGARQRSDLPESRTPTRAWWRWALPSAATGLMIIATFFLEVAGWVRLAHGLRWATAGLHLLVQIPMSPAPGTSATISHSLRTGLALTLMGLLAVAILPQWRVALLHLMLAGGLSLVTFSVATRVVFGHSGQRQRLFSRNRWMIVAFALILVGTVTRITGDFLPRILPTHYSYGAVFWAAGAIYWALQVLPGVLRADPED